MKRTMFVLLATVAFGSTLLAESSDIKNYQESSEHLQVTVNKVDLSEVVVDPLLGAPFNIRKILPAHSFSMTGFNTTKGEARVDVLSEVFGLNCNSGQYFCEIDLYLSGKQVLAMVSAGSNSKIDAGQLPATWQVNDTDNYNNIRLKKNVAIPVGQFNDKSEIEWSVPVKTFVYTPPNTPETDKSKTDPIQPLCSAKTVIGTCVSKYPVVMKLDLSSVKVK